MLPNFDATPFVLLFPDVLPEERSPIEGGSAGISADAPTFEEHPVQMEFRLTADRRRILVPVKTDANRRKDPSP
jgi:hypothetical protein